jgi:predicted nucleic acid-binding protein
MPSTPLTLLIDTNVWLDAFLPNRPEAEAARALLEEAEKRGFSLVYAAQSSLDVCQRVIINNKRWVRESSELTETWATAIKRWAWDAVTSMQELAVAVPVDMSDIWLACKYRDYHDDYEDDLVLVACRRSHADYLVTNDRKLLAHADICAKTPRQMVELLKVLS